MGDKRKLVSATLEPELWEKVDNFKWENRTNVSSIIQLALIKFFEGR